MIVNGECGQFNPELLNCFLEEIDNLLMELRQPEKQLAAFFAGILQAGGKSV